MPVAIDKPVPDFTAPATSGKEVTLSALKGKQVVLYFYPKDSTPGCTTEGQGFRDQYAAFQKANTEVFGISRDGLKSHENFGVARREGARACRRGSRRRPGAQRRLSPAPKKKAASAAFCIFHAADAIAWLPESREGPWARHPAPLSPGSPGGSRRTRPRSPRARRTATPRR